MSAPVPITSKLDAAIIDVTGQDVPLCGQLLVSATEPVHPATSTGSSDYPVPDYGYYMPRLGTKYRKKLGLTAQQVEWLDKFWPPHNVFVATEGCCVATVQLYLRALPLLEAELLRTGASLAQVVAHSQQESLRLRKAMPNPYGYGWGEYDERYLQEQTEAAIYSTLFRRCENVVREAYGNKRKLAAEFSGLDGPLAAAVEQQLGEPLDALLPNLVATIAAPDEATEVELNLQNVTRWKQQLDQLAAQLSAATTREFVEVVNRLGQRNARNPALEHIFFEASKLVAKFDREEALRFYVQYVHHDLNSATVNNKPLTKTIQKSLFPQPEHLQRFEALISQLTRDKDVSQALSQVPTVYARERRKIELNLSAIREVQYQHAGTVELLNEYLQDEPEAAVPSLADAPPAPLVVGAVPGDEIQLSVPVPAPNESFAAAGGAFVATWGLNAPQSALLAYFGEQGLVLLQSSVETFAKQHGTLRNQLIDGINERCYAHLDDVLIEEDGDTYTIYEPYYQQLATPC
ncbi:hypothetical protein BEN47_12390 [Hymenobacter lapidarius]|uniref:TerB-C domain-containing protein n=1 Tax=Hymenobacter lapidarius TaxID=1908237 RepID=A0A1G1T7C5_9BACT|nr:tellurite resistance TerB C-terminal domain-containing protein [Hymenobacter lapidarius]OGX86777.1 hypothetical protein BEN47_12390 [Hymenobacter lapidarius]